jgi:hypothetical protein
MGRRLMMIWSRMLFCSSLVLACSGNAVDLGDGPLTSGASSPGAVACESGIDCQGGQCKECLLETCLCDSDEDFRIPACVADGAGLPWPPLLSADGESLVFTVCSQEANCRFYHWNVRFGLQEMPIEPEPTYELAGISADGRQILLSDTHTDSTVLTPQETTASVYRYDIEHNTGNIVPTGVLSDAAQLLPSGVVVGLSRGADGGRHLSRWSEQRGLEVLSDVAQLFPLAATPDGSTIVGPVVGAGTVFKWSERDGLVPDLGAVMAPGRALSVKAISADGSTIAGAFDSSGYYCWSEAVGLEDFQGELVGQYLMLSDDGSVLGGLLVPEKRSFELAPLANAGVPFTSSRVYGFFPHSTTVDASARLFMTGDGVLMVSGESYFGGGQTEWSAGGPPRRVQLQADGYGGISGLSHDGNVGAGTALCGGVPAVLVREHLQRPSSFF